MVKGTTARTFSYRAGVRIRDSVLACDATGGSDLIFVSHAELIDGNAGDGNHSRRLPRARAGRRKILTTDATLALLIVSAQACLWGLAGRDSRGLAAGFWAALALSALLKGPVGPALICLKPRVLLASPPRRLGTQLM